MDEHRTDTLRPNPVALLRKSLAGGRLGHAYLFQGDSVEALESAAMEFIQSLFCTQPVAGPDPAEAPAGCGTCPACRRVEHFNHPDVHWVHPESALRQIKVDHVRELMSDMALRPSEAGRKVAVVVGVDRMNANAANAFLKTLEEPPPGVVFVLATTELEKIPETIRSRCQVLMFRRVGDGDIVQRLGMIAEREGVKLPEAVLSEIALQSRGGMRDAETTLERVLPVAREAAAAFDLAAYRALMNRVGTDRAIEVALALSAGDAGPGLHFAAELRRSGIDEREALGELVDVLRQALLLHIGGKDTELVAASGSIREQLVRLMAASAPHQLEAMIQAGVLGRQRMRELDDRAVLFDLAMVRMAQAGQLPALADLLAEVRSGAVIAAPAPAARPAAGVAPAGGPRPAAPVVSGAAGDLRTRLLGRLQDKPPLQLTIEKCRIDGPDAAGRITVRLQTEMPLHRGRLESPVVQQQLNALLLELSGAAGPVEYQLQPAAAAGAQGGGGAAPVAQKPQGAAVLRTMQKFGGRVVAVNPDDAIRGSQPAPEAQADPAPEPAPDADNG